MASPLSWKSGWTSIPIVDSVLGCFVNFLSCFDPGSARVFFDHHEDIDAHPPRPPQPTFECVLIIHDSIVLSTKIN